MIDLVRQQKTSTDCIKSKEHPDGHTGWASDDVWACDSQNGSVEIHDFKTAGKVVLENAALDASGASWNGTGRYLLLARTREASFQGFQVFDRDSGATSDLPAEFGSAAWLGKGSVVRLGQGEAQLWDAATESTVGPRYARDLMWPDSVAPSGAFVLELTPALESYLIDTQTGARTLLTTGVSQFETSPSSIGASGNERQFFAPDSARVGVPIAHGGVQLFDTKTATLIGTLTARGCETPLQIAWSPKGDLVAVGSDASHVCIFDAKNQSLVRSWEVPFSRGGPDGGTANIYLLAFFADGRGLIAGNLDNTGESISVWESATGKQLRPLSNLARGTLGPVRITTRGDALIDNARIDVHLVAHELFDFPSWGTVSDISADGRYLLNGLHSDGVPLPTFERAKNATFVTISPDGSKVFGYVNEEPSVWDLKGGKLLFP